MAKSIEQLASDLADREGIRELPLKYCDCVWRNDMTGIVDLFANDGEVHHQGVQAGTSREWPRWAASSTTDSRRESCRRGLTSIIM